MPNKKPFFIVGCVRSGTTMLRNILRTHPDLVAPEETHFYRWSMPFGSGGFIPKVVKNKTLQRHRKIDGVKEVEFLKILRESNSRRQLMVRYMKLFTEKSKKKEAIWFDKTPQNIYGLSLLFSDFPNSKYIFPVRNPLNVVSSLKEGKVMKENLKGAINFWVEAMQISSLFPRLSKKNFYVFNYEDLTSNPKEELKKIGDFLGIDSNKIQYDLNDILPEKNKYLKVLNANEAKTIARNCLPIVKKIKHLSVYEKSLQEAASIIDAKKESGKEFFFLHIPKTAGTSFRIMLDEIFEQPEIFPNVGDILANGGKYPEVEQFFKKGPKFKEKVKLFLGHFSYYRGEEIFKDSPKRIVFLREPISRAISNVFHLKKFTPSYENKSLDEIANLNNGSIDNMQVRYLSDEIRKNKVDRGDLQRAKYNLSKCSFVGITERFDESVDLIQKTFKWKFSESLTKNVNSKRNDKLVSPELRAHIEKMNKLDKELYEFGCDLFAKRLSKS